MTCALSTQYNRPVSSRDLLSGVPAQFLAAMEARGWTVQQLLDESGLKCDRSSLQRKLKGEQGLSFDEIQALVDVFGFPITARQDGITLKITPRKAAS